MSQKIRLDMLLAQRDLAPSREAARRLIMAGEVRVDGEIRDKPGMKVTADAAIEVQQAPRFVSPLASSPSLKNAWASEKVFINHLNHPRPTPTGCQNPRPDQPPKHPWPIRAQSVA